MHALKKKQMHMQIINDYPEKLRGICMSITQTEIKQGQDQDFFNGRGGGVDNQFIGSCE